MTTAWAPERQAALVDDEGDILTVLRRVYAQYRSKADELYDKALENTDKRAAILRAVDYYRTQADNIQKLLDQ